MPRPRRVVERAHHLAGVATVQALAQGGPFLRIQHARFLAQEADAAPGIQLPRPEERPGGTRAQAAVAAGAGVGQGLVGRQGHVGDQLAQEDPRSPAGHDQAGVLPDPADARPLRPGPVDQRPGVHLHGPTAAGDPGLEPAAQSLQPPAHHVLVGAGAAGRGHVAAQPAGIAPRRGAAPRPPARGIVGHGHGDDRAGAGEEALRVRSPDGIGVFPGGGHAQGLPSTQQGGQIQLGCGRGHPHGDEAQPPRLGHQRRLELRPSAPAEGFRPARPRGHAGVPAPARGGAVQSDRRHAVHRPSSDPSQRRVSIPSRRYEPPLP